MKRTFVCCQECDEISSISHPLKAGRYRCPHCRHIIFRYWPEMIERSYAMNLAGILLFALANAFPLLSFEVLGNRSEATLTTAVGYLYEQGEYLLAVAVFMTILVVPFLRMLFNLMLFAPLYHGHLPRYAPHLLRLLEAFGPWGMLDVFLVAILVSIVKLIKMGTILPDISFWAFVTLIPTLAYAQAIFDPHPLWERIEAAQKSGRLPHPRDRLA